MMAKAARKLETTGADPRAMADAAHRLAGQFSALKSLPPSWAYDIPPDGTKPCSACQGLDWWGDSEGWRCSICHPPTTKRAELARRVAFTKEAQCPTP